MASPVPPGLQGNRPTRWKATYLLLLAAIVTVTTGAGH